MNRREFIEASLSASVVVNRGKGSSQHGPGNSETQGPTAPEESSSLLQPRSFRVYTSLLDPGEHPDFERRHVRPPDWSTFGDRTHFTTLRGFEIEKNRIVNYAEAIRKYTEVFKLGDIVWPSYPIVFAENLSDLVEEIRQRDLFLFDIWGYVPGSGPGGYWQEFRPPRKALTLLETTLKERWLGMDNGEQDGRYIGGYASQMYPSSASRPQQYFNFHRHFEKLTGELGNRMTALVSLTFGHYFLKEGLYCLIGGETAQALPNGQVMYAFIRGAGKQYGVPWFGNASVWNRWGWKEYGPPRRDGSQEGGPEKGTSLSLLKRLMYSQILYNSVSVGFESGWFDAESSSTEHPEPKLSPIGVMQRAARDWVEREGQPGTMMVPFGLMLDFFAGWTVPRHLYSSNVYRVWGNLPYGPGDYWTDALLDMFYPGYQDSSYYHDESGFMTATPYGDAAECLLSDSPGWLLARYPLLVLAGGLRGGAELRDKLQAYLAEGGLLVTTAVNLKELGGLADVRVSGPARQFKPTTVDMGRDSRVALREDAEFDLYSLSFPSQAEVLAKCDGHPAAVSVVHGKGRLIALASPFGLSARPSSEAPKRLAQDVSNETDKPLAKPYVLLRHIRRILDLAFQSQMLFKVGSNVSFIVCRKGKGEYQLGIFNNSWKEQPFRIDSCCGEVQSIQETHLDRSERAAVGYLPEGIQSDGLGTNGKDRIAGGDVRIFSVRLRERAVGVIPHTVPPARPLRSALPIRNAVLIKEEILKRPTFFQNYDSVVVDWKYLWERKPEALRKEEQWIGLQDLRVIVDLTSGIDLFPQLRLIDNISQDYAASLAAIEDVTDKMQILRARDLILSLHRFPENNFTRSQSWESFATTIRGLCKKAAQAQISLHLRMAPGKPPLTLKEAISFLDRVGSTNFFLAPSVALIPPEKRQTLETKSLLKGKVGLWLVSSAERDLSGKVWSANSPLYRSPDLQSLKALMDVAPDAPVVFDAVYANYDEEYLDFRTLHEQLQPRTNP